MEIIIHRGTHTIGGTCIELKSGNCRIILDVGMPLMEMDGEEIDETKLDQPTIENGILPGVKGLYKQDQPDVSAVIISHAHLDHYGLLNHIHPSIPVYLSRGSFALIDIGKMFHPDKSKIFFENFNIFQHWKPFTIGPFKITSYLMDHSAYDASSILAEADNKKVFYSGDFRGHGRKKILVERMVNNPIKDIDCMLMEGTTLKEGHKIGFENEEEVEKRLYETFSKQKDVSFIMASGSNIDRLVSIFKAVEDCRKTLVMDLYTYYVLSRLKEITTNLPPYKDDHIRIYYIHQHAQNIVDHLGKELLYKYKNRKIEIDEIIKYRPEMVLKLPISAMKRISKALVSEKPLDNAKFIFSMWPGYLEKNSYYYDFCNQYQIKLLKVHVSGHAYLDSLKRLANALKPKMLVPVHTLSGDDFSNYFDNVVRIHDGSIFQL
jgi:ribonuclease J